MADLAGLRILIAGAGKGIGATTARMAAERGAIVSVGDIDHSVATALADSINQTGGTAHAFSFDIANECSVQDFITQSVRATGGLDCLINMAAAINIVAAGLDTSVEEMDPSIWQRSYAVNLTGFGLTTKQAIPHLKISGPAGSIVNISSGSAIDGDVIRPAYAASKAGVQALTRHTASLLAPYGVRVNAVAPGITATEDVVALTEKLGLERYVSGVLLKRMARPEEVASVVLFLISREAGYVTGQVWGVDGGMRFRE